MKATALVLAVLSGLTLSQAHAQCASAGGVPTYANPSSCPAGTTAVPVCGGLYACKQPGTSGGGQQVSYGGVLGPKGFWEKSDFRKECLHELARAGTQLLRQKLQASKATTTFLQQIAAVGQNEIDDTAACHSFCQAYTDKHYALYHPQGMPNGAPNAPLPTLQDFQNCYPVQKLDSWCQKAGHEIGTGPVRLTNALDGMPICAPEAAGFTSLNFSPEEIKLKGKCARPQEPDAAKRYKEERACLDQELAKQAAPAAVRAGTAGGPLMQLKP